MGHMAAGHCMEFQIWNFTERLHPFLKIWEQIRSTTKASLGRFYISIDKQLQERGSTPNNTYLFIEKVVSSDRSNTALMPYATTAHSRSYTAEQQDVYEDQINDRDYDTNPEVESIKTELLCTQESLKKVSHEKNVLQRERDRAYQKIHHLYK